MSMIQSFIIDVIGWKSSRSARASKVKYL